MKWLRRIRGAIGMGVTWALAWALTGVLIGVSSIVLPFLPWDAFFAIFDAPLPALGVPGFFGGLLFSVVLGIAGRRRRFSELSLPRMAALGAVGGVLLSLVPAAMVAVGLASFNEGRLTLSQLTSLMSVPCALLGAASAAGTLALARLGEKRASPQAAEDSVEV